VKVLIVNKFVHHVGGVETYVDWQARNLARIGIEVQFFGMNPPPGHEIMPSLRGRVSLTPNREFNGAKLPAAKAAINSVYSPFVEHLLNSTIDEFEPDLVHFHSTSRQLTPSVARAVTRRSLPGILTAHEYKQVCATQRLWDERRNEVCTDCLSGSALTRMKNIAVRRCVRGSTVASAFAMPEIPIADYLWNKSNVVIHAPSRFMAEVMEKAPYITNRVRMLDLPWGTPEPRVAAKGWERRAIYMGRLEKEKGIDVLLDAWEMVQREDASAELIIAGGGSELGRLKLKAQAMGLHGVRFTGRYERSMLGDLLRQVAVSVHPSEWHENSPYTVRESLLNGVPAIVSDVGGMPEMVHGESGTVVPPRDGAALARAIVAEFARRSAGTEDLRNAVAKRAMTDDDHLKGLEALYGMAASVTLR
jgi:glycosyltransferase involved in cell wall biosynthesis